MSDKLDNIETIVSFKELGLSQETLDAVAKKGFDRPTPIQIKTIPVMLKNDRNIIAQAQTGTGKTATFGLPLIDVIDTSSRQVQALVLAPTRELAIQVSEEINSLKGNKDIKIVPIYGGQSIDQQLRALKRGVHIVVGTPGRVIDHLNRKTLKLQNLDHLILDEADEMLNMGFMDDMEEIMKHTPEDKRTLLFSATMPKKIKDLAKNYMGDYELLAVEKKSLTTNLTEQIYFEVKRYAKFEALCRIIDIEDDFYSIVFCRTKRDVDEVASHLNERGYDAGVIHGDISQGQREKTLTKFRNKKINILVATDVAARGVNVDNLTHVINYSLPEGPESYVHRIGRTGRAGNKGTAITFITPNEFRQLTYIQRATKTDIKKGLVPSVKEIIEIKEQKIKAELNELLNEKVDSKFNEWATSLVEKKNSKEIIASLLSYCFEDDLDPKSYEQISENFRASQRSSRGDRDDRGGRDRGRGRRSVDMEGKTRLFIARGKKDKMNPKKLADLIMSKVKIKNREIDDIRVMDNFSFITVPFEKAEEVIRKFKEPGQKPMITLAKR